MDALGKLQSALADRYAVMREIGAGGMATVFLARDIKHDRHVALKVLRPELGAVLGVERFLSEIKVTAHLQHPHLLPLFDSGEAEGLLFYVMPYVEGESLRARLDREHQLPIDEALRITLAVASALEYAHRQGVVHRDLKPENILLQHGEPVVSDFGIALAVSNAGGARVTQTGLSLGTPQYMSPEQATGDREIDARSDQYSLAAVLYEMLTGEPPHTGKTAQAIIARVLTDKAHSTRTQRDTVPEHVDNALLRALSKLPADRYSTVGAFAEALRHPSGSVTAANPADRAATGAPTSARWPRFRTRARPVVPWLVAALGIGAALWPRGGADRASGDMVVQFAFQLPASANFGAVNSPLAVSNDGSMIALGAMPQTSGGITVRSLRSPDLRTLPGTETARSATFSPDGAWLAFVAGVRLRKVAISGGAAVTLAEVPAINTAITWGPTDEIVFSRADSIGLWIVSASGGAPRRLTRPDPVLKDVHLGPRFIPGSSAVLFTSARGTIAESRPGVATLDGKVKYLEQKGGAPRYVNDGHILFDDGAGNVMRAPFNTRRLETTGPPVPVLQNVYLRPNGTAFWDVSANGTLVQYSGQALSSLLMVSRTGALEALIPEQRQYRRPRVSPDGNKVVVEVRPVGAEASTLRTELWILDRVAKTFGRLTFSEGSMDPAWTRDGRRVAFARTEKDAAEYDIFWQPADGSAPAEALYEAPGSQWPYGFTPDGRTMLFDERPVSGAIRIGVVQVGDPKSARPLVESAFPNRLGEMSQDGKWLAYTSTESGRTEIYVRPFPGPGGRWLVSTGGGDQPLWNPNGREIFYRDGAKVVAASVSTTPTFAVTGRRVLFDDVFEQVGTLNWDVFPDGNHFVMMRPADANAQLVVTVNWLRSLRANTGTPAAP